MMILRDGVPDDPAAIQVGVDALDVLVATIQADAAALALKEKNLRALTVTVHQLADAGLAGVAALAGTEDQTATNARAELLRSILSSHLLSVGTYLADGAHKLADTARAATLNAIPAATNLATCIVLVNGLHAAEVAHGASAGVHFHDDTATASDTITTDPPTTLAHCRTDLNDIRASLLLHYAKASV